MQRVVGNTKRKMTLADHSLSVAELKHLVLVPCYDATYVSRRAVYVQDCLVSLFRVGERTRLRVRQAIGVLRAI